MKLTDEDNKDKIVNKKLLHNLRGAKKKVWKFRYQIW